MMTKSIIMEQIERYAELIGGTAVGLIFALVGIGIIWVGGASLIFGDECAKNVFMNIIGVMFGLFLACVGMLIIVSVIDDFRNY